jgi:hypothetical protein
MVLPWRPNTGRMFCSSSVTVLVPLTALLAHAKPGRSWNPICLAGEKQHKVEQQQQQQHVTIQRTP